MAKAIVEATTHYADAGIVAKVSRGLGEAMPRRRDRPARRQARRPRLVTARSRPPGHEGRVCSRCRARSASTARCSTRSASTRSRCARPEQLAGLDALVLPAASRPRCSKLLDTSGLRAPLDARRSPTGSPVFGTCAGAIVLAREVLDGRPDQVPLGVLDITARRNGYGRQRDSFEADLDDRRAPGGPFPGVFIRAPVDRSGRVRRSRCWRSTMGDPVLAREARVWVTTFHPSSPATSACTSGSSRRLDGVRCRGHSKWHSIKHTKGAADAARGKLFARLARQIEVAARSGRRRRRRQPDAAHDGAEGPRRLDAQGQHRARDQAGDRRARGRHLRGGALRGLRAERRRGVRGDAHRQPQPHRRRGQERLHPQRRVARRAGRGVVAVRAQGRGDPAEGRRPTRTTSCSWRSTPAPRTSRTRATRGR